MRSRRPRSALLWNQQQAAKMRVLRKEEKRLVDCDDPLSVILCPDFLQLSHTDADSLPVSHSIRNLNNIMMGVFILRMQKQNKHMHTLKIL